MRARPLTGADHRNVTVDAPADAVLLVDSAFALRPEYEPYWDYRIRLDVPQVLSLSRGIERDADLEGRDEATRLHRDRYREAERIYLAEVDAPRRADLLIDNTDYARPRIVPAGQ